MVYLEIALVIALILLFVLCLRQYSMKRQLKKMQGELERATEYGYNKQISVTLIDKQLIDLATQINFLLDHEKKLKFDTEQKQKQLKQSISDIAHDLRTPITVVKGNLQLMKQRISKDDKEWEYLQVCEEKIEALQRMMNDFFELSLLESEDSEVELEDIDLTKLAVEFMLQHEDVIRSYQLEPDIIFPEKSIFVRANQDFMLRVFGNLLNNVFKYAYKEFTLRLVETNQKAVELSFENQVRQEANFDIDHLFDRTYRGDKARGGYSAGLGLYIVKLLMEKQGGEVKARLDHQKLVITLHFAEKEKKL